MSARFRRGLVVGKFAPLHRGHELVIGRALAACEEVVVISYSSPEPPGCGPELRERWLAARFPETVRLVVTDERLREWANGAAARTLPANDAPATDHRAFCAYLCEDVLGVAVDAVFTSEAYGDGFAEELTRRFQARDPRAARVEHVLVDAARAEVPVSGTLLRRDVHAHRRWLAPEVYASFVERVCVLGGESTGKTTLCAALARACATTWVAEYGRELWDERAGSLAYEDLQRIADVQIAREEEALGRAHRWLFCDTSPLTTLLYCRHLFGRAEPRLEEQAGRPYHVTVLCAPDFPFVQDGTRQDERFRQEQHQWYLSELAERGIPFTLAAGPLAARVAQVRRALAGAGERAAAAAEIPAPR